MANTIITYVEEKLKELTIEELMIVSEGMQINDQEKWNAITDQKKRKRQIQRAIEDAMDEVEDVNEKMRFQNGVKSNILLTDMTFEALQEPRSHNQVGAYSSFIIVFVSQLKSFV